MMIERPSRATAEFRGHVFVTHGRIESVGHDAAVVPTDGAFSVREYWRPLLGVPPEALRPPDWPREYAQSAGHHEIWFLYVGDALYVGAEGLVARTVRLLEEVAGSGLVPEAGRTTLRVAMPVIGIAGGGMGHEQGEVILALLTGLGEAARRLGIDIVIVTPDASVFGATQHQRRTRDDWPLDEALRVRAQELGELAGEGHLALFLGAGVSIPAGLPDWSQLLQELATGAGLIPGDLEDLAMLDQAQLLQKSMGRGLGEHVARIAHRADRPSLAHVLLSGLGCAQVVTTNYDRLYEAAVRATGRSVHSVLPWSEVRPGGHWVLKMHGDLEEPASIVLTRHDFARFDAERGPAGSLLQSLLITKHVLLVGASLNDGNVARLADEVELFRRKHRLTGPFGTLLDVDGVEARQKLWSDQLHWVEMPGRSLNERARSLEVFLDVVAAYASSDFSWLLDPRFQGLLDAEERTVADQARELYQRVRDLDRFSALAQDLRRLGAESSG